MNLCPPYCPCLVHPLCIVWWKPGCPCVAVCLCPSHLISVATPCLECVHASVHEFMSTWLLMSGPPPMHSLMETWVPLYGSVFVSQSSHLSVATPCLECVHASVHEFMSTLHPMSGPPLWIVTWKVGCPCMSVCLCPIHPGSGPTPCLECVHASVHEFMSTWLLMSGPPLCIVWWKPGCPCMAVCLCPSLLISVATPCLECVQASVHEFMSTWLLMSGPPPMHSLMETWVPLYGSVFVSQSSHFCCHTFFRMCTCISTWIYVYLTPHVWSTPYG